MPNVDVVQGRVNNLTLNPTKYEGGSKIPKFFRRHKCMVPKVQKITGRVQGARFNPLSANPTKLPTNVFDHFVGLALTGFNIYFLKEFRKDQDKHCYKMILREYLIKILKKV